MASTGSGGGFVRRLGPIAARARAGALRNRVDTRVKPWHDGKLLIKHQTLRRLALIAAILAGAVPASAEAVRFASAAADPTPFMQRQAERLGTVARPTPGEMVGGDLFEPAGNGPFPAIVALHGCEGWPTDPAARQRQAERYVAQGYVVLAVDSFGPRRIAQACVPTAGNPVADRVGDAYGALDWLAAQPFVDASHVAVLGSSQGGSVVLAVLSPGVFLRRAGPRFAAGVAFYPVCAPGSAVVSVPLLVLIGALDDWTPASDCQAMAALPHDGGAPEQVLVFPGAHHAFNGPSVRDHPRDVFGHHLEYNAAADAAANTAIAGFLSDTLKR